MCKIACITKITPETSENAKKFIKVMSRTMSRNDHDGWGYAAIDAEGHLFGERWKNPDHAFSKDAIRANINAKEAIDKFKGFLKIKEVPPIQYNNFGELGEGFDSKILKGAILHARTATTPNIMVNTHPFVSGNTALIHNGSIHNLEELVMKISSCDSEAILNEYLRVGVGLDINKIGEMAGNLRGTYACGVLTKGADNHWIMDVFRDRGANLSAYFVQELDSIVIATPGVNFNNDRNYTASAYGPVFEACRQLGYTITEEYEVKTSSIVRTDLETQEVLENIDFDSSYHEKPKKGSKKQNKLSGSHHGRRQATYPDSSIYGGEPADRWDQIFGSPTIEGKPKISGEKRKWSDREKDEDLDRMLMNEVRDAESCSIVGPEHPSMKVDNNKLENAKQVIEEFSGDFAMDEHSGGWFRVALTGTEDDE
jgi:predicted glutamine amidotransferase